LCALLLAPTQVKEDVGITGAPAIFSAKGILAEFKVVGSFDVSPAPEAAS